MAVTPYQPIMKADAKPAELSSAAAIMRDRTGLLRACYGGTETMRAKEQDFLPIYERETTTRYNARLNSTFALNKLREAVDAASAKPFRTQIKLTNADPNLELWAQDIDLAGNHLHLFAHRFFNDAILDGQAHFLVDHPDTSQFASLAQQKAANVRPFWKMIRDDQLIAAYTDTVGGDSHVVHCRIQTQRMRRTPDFKEEIVNQIWVVEVEPGSENGIVQLWEQASGGGGGQWSFVGETPLSMSEVPLVSLFAGDREQPYVTRPVFMDLAYKQIEHWISSSDQRSILAAARFPMLACSGVELSADDEPNFAIGPYKVLYSPEAQGRWYYVEPKGTAIESGLKDLAMLEMHMDMMALNPVMATHRQYVPQNERDIAETRVHSVVHDLALACKDALERGIGFLGAWEGNPEKYAEVGVGLNLDFSNTKEKMAEIGLLMQAYEKRGITRETFLKEARKRDLIDDDTDIEEELRVLEALDAADAATEAAKGQGGSAPKPAEKVDFPGGRERPTQQI